MNEKWDMRFLRLAQETSTYSKDPSTKVGAVVFKNKRFISAGFNGFPKKIKDLPERLSDRDLKLKIVIHAELNAILFAKRSLKGCSIAVYPFMPCSSCSSIIIQKGIKRVIAPENDNERWKVSFDITKWMLEEAGVELLLVPKIIEENTTI